jgi:hypothetical protein
LRKACVKDCVKKQIVENQALDEFLYAFTHMRKNIPTKPIRPTDRPFSQLARFFYTITLMRNMRNKIHKIFENQGFEALRKSLRMLYACFTQTCTLAKKMI